MVVSWTLSMQRAPTRVVIEGGGPQARAYLNGGELDKEPFLRDKRGQTLSERTESWTFYITCKKIKQSEQVECSDEIASVGCSTPSNCTGLQAT